MEYNKIITGFVVQQYKDGECVQQTFTAGEEVTYEDPKYGEPVKVDVTRERFQPIELTQPVPRDIKLFVSDGELFNAAEMRSADEVMFQVARLMDKSYAYDIAGNVLFQATNGKFYKILMTAEIVEEDLGEVEIALDEQLDDRSVELPADMTVEERVHVKLEGLLKMRAEQSERRQPDEE